MSKNYIAPNLKAESYTCPHCHTISQMETSTHVFHSDMYVDSGIPNHNNIVTIHKCLCCEKKILWIDKEYIYPDLAAEEANSDMPETVMQLYNEAGAIYSKSPRAACALLRLAIDRLCNELGENDKDINKNIGSLVNKGLPKSVQQALDVVRVVGNKAVHPGQIAFDVDDASTVRMLMHLINIIVNRMISEPKEIEGLYEQLPESVKDAISKRQ